MGMGDIGNLPASRPSAAARTWSALGTVWGSVELVRLAGGAGGIAFTRSSGGGTPFDGNVAGGGAKGRTP
jgi:hypothetical protein